MKPERSDTKNGRCLGVALWLRSPWTIFYVGAVAGGLASAVCDLVVGLIKLGLVKWLLLR